MHNWLVRLILKVSIPPTLKLWGRPALKLFELLFSGSDLNAGINTIRCKGAGPLKVPLIENRLLDCGITAEEVIKRFSI